jgi:hypothetical protein
MVELIVVVVIILVLVSLSTAAVIKMIGYQQARNTEQTINKLDQAFKKQWRAVIDTAKTETPNGLAQSLANGDPRRAQVIHVLMCLKREFPMSIAEARSPLPSYTTFLPNPAYVTALKNAAASGHDEKSACLYMALKQTRRGVDFDPDSALSSQELVDPVGDGVKEIYDGWGQPIEFIRWPVGLPNIPSGSPQIGTLQAFNTSSPPDPQDPEGLLASKSWLQFFQQPAQQALPGVKDLFAPPGTQQAPYWPYPLGGAGQQYQLTPVIVSAGPTGGKPAPVYNFTLSSLGGQR